jgi:hypothetical protein
MAMSENANSKHLATPFSASSGPIRSGETVASIWPQVVQIAYLQEFYKNDRFLPTPQGTSMAHFRRRFHTFDLEHHIKNEISKKKLK